MEVISIENRKARKEHRCNLCCGAINKGETYGRQFITDGDAYVWKYHLRCLDIARELDMFDLYEGVDESSFHDYIDEAYSRLMDENELTKRNFHDKLDFVCEKLLNKQQ